ncbi:MAG: glycosyltransferase family 4 protein [Anaerolineaceae bacterium]|nr:glycosyltransferase family 4 protein [Anaerolineaceae bacterium]
MRICLLSLTYPPANTEGISRQRQALAEELARQGHTVHVVTCGVETRIRYESGVTIHDIQPGGDNLYVGQSGEVAEWVSASEALSRGLTQARSDGSFDIIDAPLWSAQGFVSLASCSDPVVIWLQTTLAQLFRFSGRSIGQVEKTLLSMDQYCLNHASGILADSKSIMDAVRQDYRLPESILAGVAHLGLPSLQISNADWHRTGCEALIVGRLEERKGTPFLLDVLPRVLNRHPQLTVRFVGSDNSQNDGWLQRYGKTYAATFRAKHPEFDQRVWFEGYVDDERMDELYQKASFLLVPSLYESFGLIYLEAMRCSLPVISFAIDAACEIFPAGEQDGAILTPIGNRDDFTLAIGRLINQAGLGEKIGRCGLERFMNAFTAEKMAQATLEFYRQVINHHTKPTRKAVTVLYQVMEALDLGDAVSQIAVQNAALLGELGQPDCVLTKYSHPGIAGFTKPIHTLLAKPDCGLIFHYWNYNHSTWTLSSVRGPKALYYHNITPPEYFKVGSPGYFSTTRGYQQLAEIVNDFDLLIGDSGYNLSQLTRFLNQPIPGLVIHPHVDVCALQAESFDRTLEASLRQSGSVNFLFVSRVARNKRQDQLIRLFDDYYGRIDRHASLWLVGNDQADPDYRAELERLRLASPAAGHIHFTGKVTRAQLLAYYRSADAFICASEHEGFCVPIVEAMAFELPVFAYAATAVPETMGKAGILLRKWDVPRISELLHLIVIDPNRRAVLLKGQQENLLRFSTSEVKIRLQVAMQYLLNQEPCEYISSLE